MKKASILLLVTIVFSLSHLHGETYSFHVSSSNIHKGYCYEKVRLLEFEKPIIKISDIIYQNDISLPVGAIVSTLDKIAINLGMEKKIPFASVMVPIYIQGADGKINQVTDFKLEISESPNATAKSSNRTIIDKRSSVLATGTWYKIGLTNDGFYKIDYNFISSLGIDPNTINPANIRIFGNGGHMLAENNAILRPSDLTENAIIVNASGSTFGKNDYVLFYGVGTVNWTLSDSINGRFTHHVNLYSDTAYYFISFNLPETGLRINKQPTPGSANTTVNTYNYYDQHELELVNPPTMGKLWYGEQFNSLLGNTNQTFSFNAGSYIDSVYCTVSIANQSNANVGSTVTVATNNNVFGTTQFNTKTGVDIDNRMNLNVTNGISFCGANTINVGINFKPIDVQSICWLDYIEVNARRQLIMNGDQMNFRDVASIGFGNIATYQLQGAQSGIMVWDITNPQVPVVINGTLNGGTYTFTQDAQSLHEFAAINNTNFYIPKYIGKVDNQNLHALPQVNCIIVTNPEFLEQANQLAAYHQSHDNMSVAVATTTQIYNEFSSGAQDLSAIRDFAKMFYNRAGTDSSQMPQYLVIFGGASYDYKNRIANNSNFVPVFESYESLDDLNSYCSDDFYSFLDDHEYIENYSIVNACDIGVGRLPARSVSDAKAMVNKIMGYATPATLGSWRISASFVADAADGAGDHTANAEEMATTVGVQSKNLYNINKDYIELLPVISTPAGERCPDLNAALDNQIYKGDFFINYNGHGNTQVWSSKRILTQDDYNNWQNTNQLPFMVTATCDFGQFDQPTFVSAAEQLVLLPKGGAIAMLTTTQAVYAGYNVNLNMPFLQYVFSKPINNKFNTFGESVLKGKNNTYIVSSNPPVFDPNELVNFRKFALLGDPAVTPDYPQNNIVIDSIIDVAKNEQSSAIKALGAYKIYGHIADNSNNLMNGFNGVVNLSFYDKFHNVQTVNTTNRIFSVQDNLIYKGIASVTNGEFSVIFIVPKDISYSYGNGKISTYAQNGITDAAGTDSSLTVGGFSDNAVLNTEPPVVKPYINDSLFHDGGITGTNTSLFVILESKTGINVTGSSVGHDLKAVLDDNIEQPYILNDFYETGLNTYQRGYVNFPINSLPDGKHHLKVTAWDVNDNSGEGGVNFVVLDGTLVAIQELGNYPNPFSNLTHFVFEHNHPEEQLHAQIEIYNMAGTKVKKIDETFTPEGSWSNDITWDGTDETGSRLPSGVYVYRLTITSDKGFVSSAYQKLVIVR